MVACDRSLHACSGYQLHRRSPIYASSSVPVSQILCFALISCDTIQLATVAFGAFLVTFKVVFQSASACRLSACSRVSCSFGSDRGAGVLVRCFSAWCRELGIGGAFLELEGGIGVGSFVAVRRWFASWRLFVCLFVCARVHVLCIVASDFVVSVCFFSFSFSFSLSHVVCSVFLGGSGLIW